MSQKNNEIFTNESVIFLYINKNSHLYDKVNSKLFEDKFIQRFYSLCRRFHKKYNTTIFDSNNKSVEQIRKFLSKHKDLSVYDSKLTHEENVDLFVENVKMIFQHNLSLYSEESIEDSFRVWFVVRSGYTAIIDGVEYFKKSKELIKEYSLEEISREIRKVRNIINGGFDIDLDDDLGQDIYDRELHMQPSATELFPLGWSAIDRWNSGQDEGKGGFEPGTLTYLIGPPNSGKSVFLWNMAYRFFYYGANVLGGSLEMANYKIAKRIGSNAFNVDIGTYSKFVADEAKFNSSVREFKIGRNDELSLTPEGKLRIKRFSTATVTDLERFIDRVEDRYGIKTNVFVLDYATELANSSGLGGDKMYSYHKENCNELFAMTVEKKIATLTAHQMHVRHKGEDDSTLQMIAESSAITQRPDYIYGIIHSDKMKAEHRFQLKLLKARDSGQVNFRTNFDINWQHMKLIAKDDFIDPAMTDY